MKRYEAYKDSGVEWIGEIPAGWEVRPIWTIATYNDEILPETTDDDWRFRYIDISAVSEGSIDSCSSQLFKNAPSRARRIIRCDDILVSTVRTYLKAIAPVDEQHDGCIASTGFCVLRPKREADGRWFGYAVSEESTVNQIVEKSVGVSYPAINASEIARLKLRFPPFDEQRAIADFLDTKTAEIDALVADCEREVELLQEYRKAVISEAVTKGLDPSVPMKDSGIEWIGEIPEEWSLDNLGSHSWMLTPMRDKPGDLTGPIPWVRIEDYDGKYISASREGLGVSKNTIADMNLKVYPVGTLLCTSSCDLGKCAIVSKELVSNQRFIGIIPTDYNVDYLYYSMLSSAERLNVLSTGTIQANLSRKAFEHLKLPYPSIAEQESIASYLDAKTAEIDSLIDAKRQMIEKLREYRKSLISEAVTGKFKVPGV